MRAPGFAGVEPVAALKRAVTDFFDDQMLTYAAALAYHVRPALFPFTIFLLTLLGALGLPEFFNWLLAQSRLAPPPDTYAIVQGVVEEVRGQRRGNLLSFSILFAIWAASAGVRAVMTALNAAYAVEATRPPWQRLPLSVLYTIGLAVLLIAATGLMLLGPRVAQWLGEQLGIAPVWALVWSVLRWPIVAVLLLATVAIVYAIAPNIDQPFRFVTPGSAIAVAVWIAASVGFAYYVDNFATFSATYGSLGGDDPAALFLRLGGGAAVRGGGERGDSARFDGAPRGHPAR